MKETHTNRFEHEEEEMVQPATPARSDSSRPEDFLWAPEVETKEETEPGLERTSMPDSVVTDRPESETISPDARKEQDAQEVEKIRADLEKVSVSDKEPPAIEPPPEDRNDGDSRGGEKSFSSVTGEIHYKVCEKCHGSGRSYFVFNCGRCGGTGAIPISKKTTISN